MTIHPRSSRMLFLALTCIPIALVSAGPAAAFCNNQQCGSPVNKICTVQMYQQCGGNDSCWADEVRGNGCYRDCVLETYLNSLPTAPCLPFICGQLVCTLEL